VIQAARSIAAINGVKCEFQTGNICKLPITSNSIDIIVGIDILHHLSKPDVLTVFDEMHRVLRNGGRAIFVEPVENSRAFNFIQNVFPAGRKYSGYYRPSCLCPTAWAKYCAGHDGRDITSKEFKKWGEAFGQVAVKSFGLLDRIDRFITDARLIRFIRFTDSCIFKFLPFLERYSRQVIVEYKK
jgi:ubiquinone/menaquinone biosynthesis C-methylase UbiE